MTGLVSAVSTESPALDLHARDYMARRALAILVASSLERRAGEPVSFAPVPRKGIDSVRLLMRPVAHLTNVWLGLRDLRRRVLHLLSDSPETLADRPTEQHDHAGPRFNRIDWQQTLARRSSGNPGVVARALVRCADEPSAAYVVDVLREIVIHAERVAHHLEREEPHLPGAVLAMLQDVEKWAEETQAACSSAWLKMSQFDESAAERIAAAFDNDLDVHVSQPLFSQYCTAGKTPMARRPQPFLSTDLCRRLHSWRDQYFSGEAWISPKPGFQTQSGRDDALYEIWCFSELLNAARNIGEGGISQNSFLRRRAGAAPEFSLGEGRYAYFDFRNGRFKAVAPTTIASQGSALPRAHVEWFLRHGSDYRQSVVIDTKYYLTHSWDSGEALKVLGYMMNFGVANGAIVFPVYPPAIRGVESESGLIRLTCPDAMGSTLWVLTLVPEPAAERANESVIRRFLKSTILRT